MYHGFAYFLPSPRTHQELCSPHLVDMEREFIIEKTVELSSIEYENFISDMISPRSFIEEQHSLCFEEDGVLHCLLVRDRYSHHGILVMPKGHDRVGCAAFYGMP